MECEKLMNSKMTVLNIDGSNGKCVGKEVFDAIYMLTYIPSYGTPAKTLSELDQKELLGMTPEMITRSWLGNSFGSYVNCTKNNHNTKGIKTKWETYDKMTVPANYFYQGQPTRETTVGRFIFNKFLLEGASVISQIGYVNDVVGKAGVGTIDQLIGTLYMEDKITRSNFNSYIDRRDCLGYWLCGMICNSITPKFTKPLPEVEKKKAELLKKYEKELAAKDVDVMTKIDKELTDYAREMLQGDPGMEMYNSGNLDFNNNYKNNSIVKGAVLNQITGEFDYISASFMDGIEVENIPAYANSILASQYPASVATKDAGYNGKKLLALLQMMEIDEPGTDCHTKQGIPIKITKTNIKMMRYTNIIEGGQLKLLDSNNINQYLGKTVLMRSPETCLGSGEGKSKICATCAGSMFNMLGIEHAGLFGVQISHSDLNLGLKAKHNSVVELHNLNVDDLIMDI